MLTIQNFNNFVGHSSRLKNDKMVVIHQVSENMVDYCIEVVFNNMPGNRFSGLTRFYLAREIYKGRYPVLCGNFVGRVAESDLMDMSKLMIWIASFINHHKLC